MKRLLLFFYLYNVVVLAQDKPKILIVLANQEAISFDGTCKKMLKYNEIEVDSASKYIQTTVLNQFQLAFKGFSMDVLGTADFALNEFRNLPLSKRKYRFERVIDNKEDLLKIAQSRGYKYIVFFNQFETITKKPFSNKTSTRFYFEVYNEHLKRELTTFSHFKFRISKKMYYSAFQYEFRYSINHVLRTVIKEIKYTQTE